MLIDEAYHQYAGHSGAYASFIEAPVDDERVIVTRTFSKVYGLAGLRLGYAVASPRVIEKMRRFLTADSLNAIVAEAVGAALDDVEGVASLVKRNADDRQEFHNQAMLRMLVPIDSHANFVMMNTQHSADEVIEHFRKKKDPNWTPLPADGHSRSRLPGDSGGHGRLLENVGLAPMGEEVYAPLMRRPSAQVKREILISLDRN